MNKRSVKTYKSMTTTTSPSAVEQLAGSLKTSVPYVDHAIARKYAAQDLAKRLLVSVSVTQFCQRFAHYVQLVRDGEALIITHRKYPNDHFVIRPHRSKTDASVFAELVRL